jgi:hypothetical protein
VSRRSRTWWCLALLACAGALARGRPARADGAFPDSLGLLTPADLPHDFFLATNFGLVSSVDDGQTWQWTCEEEKTSFGFLYQLGPSPLLRLYALSQGRLVFTDDAACTWTVAAPPAGTATVLDAFPDPTNPSRVVAIGLTAADGDGGAGLYQVLESSDSGATFGTVRYTAAAGDTLTGIEIARSRPTVVYVTLLGGAAHGPELALSTDGGVSWQVRDLRDALPTDTTNVLLVSVDPSNPAKLLLRVRAAGGEQLAVSDDAGATFRMPLTVPGGALTSFARLPSGTLVLSGARSDTALAFRSTDGAQTFQPLPGPPHLRGLSARGAILYGVADNVVDGYAIGASADEGSSWQPIMRYDDIQAISTCVKAQCQDDCTSRADQGYWPAALCSATAAPRPVATDAGQPADGAAVDAGTPSSDGAGGDAGGGAPGSGGCHCEAGGGPRGGAGTPFAAAGAALLLRGRRRRRQAPRRAAHS